MGWEHGRVVLVGDEPHRPYTRPPLSKEVLDGRHELADRRLPVRRARRRVAPRHARDRARRRRAARSRSATSRSPTSTLIIATGTRARTWPGETGRERLHAARPRRRARASRPRWRPPSASRSSAPASSAARWHRAPASSASTSRCIDVAPQPMPALGPELGAARLHAAAAPRARRALRAARAARPPIASHDARRRRGRRRARRAAEHRVARGLRPDARPRRRLRRDLQAAPHVFAAGDIAVWPHPMAGGEHDPRRALDERRRAGHARRPQRAGRGDAKPYTAVPYFWTDQYDVKIQAAGLPARAERVELIEPDVAVGLARRPRRLASSPSTRRAG